MSVVKNSVLALAMLAIAPVFAAVTINIDPAKRGAVINKNVYGQFAEHLGAGIYEGMWVGSGSTIPNTKGWRDDVVGALKDMHVPLVRWPGGSFADEYHWKDGIGPRAERPVKVNSNWGGVEVLTAAAMDAHNTFTQEDAVKPAPFAAKAADGKLRLKIPAKAVVVVALDQ